MPVNTKSVQGRRELNLLSLDEVVQDAEALVASEKTRTLGNWPLSKLLTHLAMTVECSMDGFPTPAPWFVRMIGPLLKKGMLIKKMAPGLQLPKKAEAEAFPAANSPQEALDRLRAAVVRSKTMPMVAAHPAFGKMTHDEWNQLHLRHSEMHLSFAVQS